jgi:hypothetical protein
LKKSAVLGIGAVAVVIATILIVVGIGIGRSSSSVGFTPNSADRFDFMFQVDGYRTANQGGQTLNLYFSYRYNEGLADADIPDYRKLRTMALGYLDGIDPKANLYWELLDREMCRRLKAGFPVQAISCQMQVFGNNQSGVRNEPGFHSTVYTIGDIAALAVPGPINGAP